MNTLKEKTGVWFVYDGECPICAHAAKALRIKHDYGGLHTLDARTCDPDPLLEEINRRGLDLDEGMVIYANDTFYHGKQALTFMAQYGEAKNPFMAVFKSLFWSNTLAKLMYPWLRGTRNWLLRQKHVERIDNLQLKNQPTFKSIFGESWNELPPVFKKHYANRPYTQEETIVKGTLNVMCKPPLLWLSSLMSLLGQIPARNDTNVPVTVHFHSDLNTKSFHFNRIFNFPNGKPYTFQSSMVQIKGNEVIEIMRFGLGWKMHYAWDGQKVVLSHKGYALRLFGHFVPLPLTLLMGAGYAEERPVDDNTFDMETHITHPWWGKIYEYKGRFEVPN
jgi:predicted DCC family thiol-disulfide oxidoreductase YuxK